MRLFLFYSFLGNIKVFFCYFVAYKVPFLFDTSDRSSSTPHTIIKYQIALVGICPYKPPYKINGFLCRMMVITIVFLIHTDYACRILFVSNLCFSNGKVTIASIPCATYPISSFSCEVISSSFFLPPFVIFPYTPPDLLAFIIPFPAPPRLWFTCPKVN